MASGIVSSSTNTSPIVITATAHGRTTGDLIAIGGMTSNMAANGAWIITVLTADTFSLNSSTGNGSGVEAGTWNTTISTISVTGATNASPIVISATSHGLSTGNFVRIGGVVGNEAANGVFSITVVNANSFSLDGSTGTGSYISGGEVVVVTSGVVTGATNADPVVITSAAHGLVTGDVIILTGAQGNTAANVDNSIIAFPITKIDANSFSLDSIAGNAAWTSGGDFVKLPSVNLNADATNGIRSSVTTSSGASNLVLLGDQSGVIPDGFLVQYSVMIGSAVLESGSGTYSASSNSIVRQAVSYNGGDNVSPVLLPSGAKSVFFVSGGGDPDPIIDDALLAGADLQRRQALAELARIEREMASLTRELFLNTTDAENFNRASMNEVSRLLAELRVRRERITVRYNITVPGVNPPPIPMPPPSGTTPGILPRGTGPTRAGVVTPGFVGAASIIIIGGIVIYRAINDPPAQEVQKVVQGVLSANPVVVNNDQDRQGVSDTIYFVPLGTLGNPADAAITLYHANGRNGASGWARRRIVGLGTAQGRSPMGLSISSQPRLPFQIDSTKIDPSTTTYSGLPADIFAYIPAYTDINSRTAQPQMFFLNWASPLARKFSTKGFGLAHSDPNSNNDVITLRTTDDWCTDDTIRGTVPNLYLYLGTIIPIANGRFCCLPNIRLMINQFNRIAYTDRINETTQSWLVNPEFHSNAIAPNRQFERMNPFGQGSSWTHFYADPFDTDPTLDSPYTNANSQFYIPSSSPYLRFGYAVSAFGGVEVNMSKRSLAKLVTNATNATPIVITCTGHGLSTGNVATIQLVRGNTSANGTRTITRINANSFSLDGSVGNGVFANPPGIVVPAASFGQFFDSSNDQNCNFANNDDQVGNIVGNLFNGRGPNPVQIIGELCPGLNSVSVYQRFTAAGMPSTFSDLGWGFFGGGVEPRLGRYGIDPNGNRRLANTPSFSGLTATGEC